MYFRNLILSSSDRLWVVMVWKYRAMMNISQPLLPNWPWDLTQSLNFSGFQFHLLLKKEKFHQMWYSRRKTLLLYDKIWLEILKVIGNWHIILIIILKILSSLALIYSLIISCSSSSYTYLKDTQESWKKIRLNLVNSANCKSGKT